MKAKRFVRFFFVSSSLLLLLSFMTEARVGIVGGLDHERNVEANKTYQGVIFVKNLGEEPQEVKVYQTDFLFFCDGSNLYGEPGKDPRSNAKWISFSPRQLTIAPQQTSAVNYTIKVPDDKSLKGTYWSSIMIEGLWKSAPKVVTPGKEEVKASVIQNIRYNIKIRTHLGNTGSRELKFLDTKLLREGEKRILQADIENTGERFLKPRLWAELYDKEGAYIGRFEAGILRTYPGTSVRFKIDLSGVPEGEYKALIVADCGGDAVFGITHTLKLKN